MTTGYILQSLHSLKNSMAEIRTPSPEKLMKTKEKIIYNMDCTYVLDIFSSILSSNPLKLLN
jgi:hypothetical protein